MRKSRSLATLVAVGSLGLFAAQQASADIITQWTFENQPVTTPPPYNNSPTPSTGSGTAGSIGMDIYPTPNVGTTSDDIILGVTGDTGTNSVANTSQIWRVRAQGTTQSPANGWSSAAPIGTQGAQFAASTVNYSGPINVSFDWYSTSQGEAKLQLEYTNDGTHWINTPINVGSDAPISALTNNTSSNTVMGAYVWGAPTGQGQEWFNGLTATINDPLAAGNPNFAIEMVNAATGADNVSMKNTALNNNSGNWRFDNVTISGTVATPEPASAALLGLGALGLLRRRSRKIA